MFVRRQTPLGVIKLCAPFNPFSVVDDNFINTKIAMRKAGRYSSVIEFKEESLQEAIDIAKQF